MVKNFKLAVTSLALLSNISISAMTLIRVGVVNTSASIQTRIAHTIYFLKAIQIKLI